MFEDDLPSVDIGKLRTASGNFIFFENLMMTSASLEMLAI